MKRYINRFTKGVKQMDIVDQIIYAIGVGIAIIGSKHSFVNLNEGMHWIFALGLSVVVFLVTCLVIPIFILLLLYELELLCEWVCKKLRR